MPRPRTVDNNGKVHRLTVVVSQSDLAVLRKEAKKKGVTVGAVVRDRLKNEF